MKSAALSNLASERLPRYTSYPTAPRFSGAVSAAHYRDWVAALPADTRVSLYVHIPFCRAMCWYCGCHTTITRRDEPIARYLAALHREIGLLAEVAGPLAAGHVHFGGGTPTVMTPDDFAALIAALRGSFRMDEATELAVEIDPRTLTAAMAEMLGRSGVRRASLGVQTFDPAVQRAINRVQSLAQTAAAIEALRRSGVGAINIDLIYGLPLQTVRSCIETVAQCLSLRPARFSVFGYAHVPSFKKHQRRIETATLPDAEARQAQAEAISAALNEAGYVRIGLDHFALPDDPMARAQANGTLRRNFQGYTTDRCDTLVGFGASAIGRLPQGYVQNEVALPAYIDRTARGELATAKGYQFQGDDRLRAELIERLMCDLKVDVAEICARHGVPPATLADAQPRLRELADDGIITIDGGLISIPDRSRLLLRHVASAFDAYLTAPGRTFSPAV